MTSSQQRRLSVQILLLSVDASLRPERCQSVCFLGFRRISRLCEYSQYFTILKAFQGNFTWRLYLPPVQVPLGSGGISSFCDRAGRGPLRRAWPVSSQVSSVAFCNGYFKELLLRVLYSVYFYLRYAAHGGTCVSLQSIFSEEGVIEHFFTLFFFLEWFSIRCLCAFHWFTEFIEALLCRMWRWTEWWASCPRGACGFEGCHLGVCRAAESFFLHLLCRRASSVDSFV